MSKKSTSYYISEENKAWLSRKAKAIDRKASWYLNDLLNKLRNGNIKDKDAKA